VAIKENWVSAVSRILLAIQRKNHGATLIWRGGPPHGGLAFNYRLNYDRLSGALHDLAVATIKHVYARDQIFERYLDRDGDLISADLYLEEAVNVNTKDEVMGEVSGCAA